MKLIIDVIAELVSHRQLIGNRLAVGNKAPAGLNDYKMRLKRADI